MNKRTKAEELIKNGGRDFARLPIKVSMFQDAEEIKRNTQNSTGGAVLERNVSTAPLPSIHPCLPPSSDSKQLPLPPPARQFAETMQPG